MSKLLLFIAAIASLLLSQAGCSGGTPATGGTETGNTTALSIRVVGYRSSQLVPLGLPGLPALTVGDLEITTAEVVLDRLTFQPFSACDSGGESEGAEEIRFDGPFVVDLLDPTALSGLEDVAIAAGRYCKIQLVFKKLEGDLPSGVSPSDPIVNRSILIEGDRSDGTNFQMTTEIDEEFKLENEATGFLIDAASGVRIFFIAFDLDQWFTGVDLADPSVDVSTDGSGQPLILINDANNETIQETIEENMKVSADLFKDSDEDEQLDPEEEEDSLAEGATLP